VRQAEVEEVVSLLGGGEQMWRWPRGAGSQEWVSATYQGPPPGERPWELPGLRRLPHATTPETLADELRESLTALRQAS
jgi:hypothetical protein